LPIRSVILHLLAVGTYYRSSRLRRPTGM